MIRVIRKRRRKKYRTTTANKAPAMPLLNKVIESFPNLTTLVVVNAQDGNFSSAGFYLNIFQVDRLTLWLTSNVFASLSFVTLIL